MVWTRIDLEHTVMMTDYDWHLETPLTPSVIVLKYRYLDMFGCSVGVLVKSPDVITRQQ